MLSPLPIGLQDFRTLRERGFLYVDKTEDIHRVVQHGGYFFLSRPRRFGKSLTVATLKELFSGSRALFEGLWIEPHWDWSRRHPVIHLAFNAIGYRNKGLERALTDFLSKEARKHDLTLTEEFADGQLQELIERLHEKYGERVVLLIDEYDKPIIDYLDDVPKAEAQREELKTFYSGLKSMDPHLQLLFITGVSKFSRVSIFSELNNLTDLTIHPAHATLMGYSQAELEQNFGDYLARVGEKRGESQTELLAQLRLWYNGYSWNGQDFLYNPVSTMSFLNAGKFQNFWFATGTPSFLVKLLKERKQVALSEIRVDESAFESLELGHLGTYALLFQTGYLTIKAEEAEGRYLLDYPNREVKESMLRHLIMAFQHDPSSQTTPLVLAVRDSFRTGDLKQVFELLNSLFKSIPSHLFIAQREAYYHSLVYLLFDYLGIFLDAEVHTSDGRIDAVVQTESHIYLLEFKLDASPEAALAQIRAKGYADRYRGRGKALLGVGVNFSSENKAIEGWEVLALRGPAYS